MRRVEFNLNADGELTNIGIHLSRYKFCSSFLKSNDKVLEIGCGFGYGSRLMSESCLEVLGIDGYEEGITFATNNFKRNNLKYKSTYLNQEFVDSYKRDFDTVVCLEVIEHIEQEEQNNFIRHILALDPKLVIISTPRFYAERSENRKKEHAHEFTVSEFKEFLSNHFSSVDIYGQNDEIITMRTPESLSMCWNMIAVCRR